MMPTPFLFPVLLCLVVFLASSSVWAADDAGSPRLPNVAVIPVTGDDTINSEQLGVITVKLSGELMRANAFTLLDRGRMEFILKEQGFQQSGACNTSECQVQVGQLLGVDYIVAGNLVRFGRKYAFHADLIDVANGKVVYFAEQSATGELEDVFESLCQGVAVSLAKQSKGEAALSGVATGSASSSVSVPVVEMISVPAGCFRMGSGDGESDEKPVHNVCLSAFQMDKYEVTQGEYVRVMRRNPSSFNNCGNCPVEQVSWREAKEYCSKEGKRLPTEAEWEYAARGGDKSQGYVYAGSNHLDKVAWYGDNSGGQAHPVGQKQPNEIGLYDMSGNVWEWTADWYGSNDYGDSPAQDPRGPTSGSVRVNRGGSWRDNPAYLRSANRGSNVSGIRFSNLGFRCVSR